MRTLKILSVLTVAFALLMSCEMSEMEAIDSIVSEKSATIDGVCTNDSAFTTTADDLTEADIAGLMLMREEEKMAGDVYTVFFDAYGLTVFNRISVSEDKHADAVLTLINYYGLEDPASTEPGVFNNTELQALYNQLIEAGSDSVEALQVGALIEETDIADLQELIEGTDNADIERVYANLLRGSYQHLKAFVRILEKYGVTYVPQILSEEVFAEILATPNGQYRGNGQGMNAGNSGQQNRQGNGPQGNAGNGSHGGNGNAGNGGNNGHGSGNGTGTCVNG
ncbi:MAG: DUF2202 domain-containing protein [Prolixibacteraceae bacterium]|nr:DUF2202 domain-containing protein [Prolixibacteraceae bacterium]